MQVWVQHFSFKKGTKDEDFLPHSTHVHVKLMALDAYFHTSKNLAHRKQI